ncbi:MAG: hypothetical protein ACLTTJ_14180 [Blautia sp.]
MEWCFATDLDRHIDRFEDSGEQKEALKEPDLSSTVMVSWSCYAVTMFDGKEEVKPFLYQPELPPRS